MNKEIIERLDRIEQLLLKIAPVVKRVYTPKDGTPIEIQRDKAVLKCFKNLVKLDEVGRRRLNFPAAVREQGLAIIPRSLLLNRVSKLLCFTPTDEEVAAVESGDEIFHLQTFVKEAFKATVQRLSDHLVEAPLSEAAGLADDEELKPVLCIFSVTEAYTQKVRKQNGTSLGDVVSGASASHKAPANIQKIGRMKRSSPDAPPKFVEFTPEARPTPPPVAKKPIFSLDDEEE